MSKTLVAVDCGQPEYLDGVAMQGEVRIGNADGAPIAYCEIEHAALFAAAPELLAALEKLLILRDPRDGVERRAMKEAQAAIDKAYGSDNAGGQVK